MDGPFLSETCIFCGFFSSCFPLSFLKNSKGDEVFLVVTRRTRCCLALGAREPVLVTRDWNSSLIISLLLAGMVRAVEKY